jgi:hypothetical protein
LLLFDLAKSRRKIGYKLIIMRARVQFEGFSLRNLRCVFKKIHFNIIDVGFSVEAGKDCLTGSQVCRDKKTEAEPLPNGYQLEK